MAKKPGSATGNNGRQRNGLHREGEWKTVYQLVRELPVLFQESRELCLKRWALKAEAVAKKHLSSQDLQWEKLKAATVAAKIRLGQSENILIATSTYFTSITSWNTKDTAYAGVKRDVRYVTENGDAAVADIARIQEFGTTHIPKRPLWGPTMDEVKEWHFKKNSPVDIFLSKVRRYKV